MTTAVQKAPRLTEADAVRMVAELYGLSVSAAPLPSERDQNFYCKAGNDQFVLKIANSEEVFEFLELQNRLILFLAGRDIALERVHGTVGGGRRYRARQLGADRGRHPRWRVGLHPHPAHGRGQ